MVQPPEMPSRRLQDAPGSTIDPGVGERYMDGSEAPVCIYSILVEKIRSYQSTFRFLDCKGCCDDCLLGCNSYPIKTKPLEIALFSLVDEAYKIARMLYALQKSIHDGKEPFGINPRSELGGHNSHSDKHE